MDLAAIICHVSFLCSYFQKIKCCETIKSELIALQRIPSVSFKKKSVKLPPKSQHFFPMKNAHKISANFNKCSNYTPLKYLNQHCLAQEVEMCQLFSWCLLHNKS